MRSSGSLARGAAAALTVLFLAACGGNGSTACVPPPPPVDPPITQIPALISPAPGATGVSIGPLDVTIGNAVDAQGLYLNDGGSMASNYATGTNFRPANPPSTDVQIATFAQLAPQTKYQVYATVRVHDSGYFNPCGINPIAIVTSRSQLLGSFTTR